MRFSIKDTDKLPSTVGVYIFEANKKSLYIGKSINIKARVKAHLEAAKFDQKENNLIKNSKTILVYPTENEYQALVLEANLIQKHLPKYNVRWRDDKSFLYIKITNREEYPKIYLSRKPKKKDDLYFGPFSSVVKTQELLRTVRKIVPFCTQKKLTNRACFYSKIGLCNPCPSLINQEKNELRKEELKKKYQENIKKIIKILQGKTTPVMKNLKRKLKRLIDEEKYEEAKIIRDQIFQLEQLNFKHFYDLDEMSAGFSNLKSQLGLVSILKPYFHFKKISRIECYDISNLKGKEATASMVVTTGGFFDKSQYRRFKIKNQRNKSDLSMMDEVFQRRFLDKKLPHPDLIIVDGGKPQLKIVKPILDNLKINIPLIGIAKDPDRLVLASNDFLTIKLAKNHPGFNYLRLIRDESHRFAHDYHLFLRKKNFLL